jgi:hypothetical protein
MKAQGGMAKTYSDWTSPLRAGDENRTRMTSLEDKKRDALVVNTARRLCVMTETLSNDWSAAAQQCHGCTRYR